MRQRKLLRSPRALCKALGGRRSIWKYLEARVRTTEVSGKFHCGFGTDINYAHVVVAHALSVVVITSAKNLVSVRNTVVFLTALTALTEPYIL
jgi:hypothetical protein